MKRWKNNLGITGWGLGGRWGIERYLYTLHRLTGLGILTYFLMHIFVTSARVLGQPVWDGLMDQVQPLPFKIGEFLVYLAFAFHGCNGFRLAMIEFGLKPAVGEADEPVYPYKGSLNRQRPLLIICMIVSAMLVLIGGINLLRVIQL